MQDGDADACGGGVGAGGQLQDGLADGLLRGDAVADEGGEHVPLWRDLAAAAAAGFVVGGGGGTEALAYDFAGDAGGWVIIVNILFFFFFLMDYGVERGGTERTAQQDQDPGVPRRRIVSKATSSNTWSWRASCSERAPEGWYPQWRQRNR